MFVPAKNVRLPRTCTKFLNVVIHRYNIDVQVAVAVRPDILSLFKGVNMQQPISTLRKCY